MPDCKSCKENNKNDELVNVEPVPYIAHEAEMARLERQHDKERDQLKDTIKKLWIALILVIFLLVATNGAWIAYEDQWEHFDMEITQENDGGVNNYIGEDGNIYNGSEASEAGNANDKD